MRVSNKRYWVISPFNSNYPGAWQRVWDFDLAHGIISIGWREVGNPTSLTEPQLAARILRSYSGETMRSAKLGAGMLYKFCQAVEPGHIVIARRGVKRIAGIGSVVRAAYYDPGLAITAFEPDHTDIAYPTHLTIKWRRSLRNKEFPAVVFTHKSIYEISEEKFRTLVETEYAADFAKPPNRVTTTICRPLRDTKLSLRVKSMHNYECQICGSTIKLPNGFRYAEGHHIQPLGAPHNGPDVLENILCLCPNHHAELDFGVRPLSLSSLRQVTGHCITSKYIHYHNGAIFKA